MLYCSSIQAIVEYQLHHLAHYLFPEKFLDNLLSFVMVGNMTDLVAHQAPLEPTQMSKSLGWSGLQMKVGGPNSIHEQACPNLRFGRYLYCQGFHVNGGPDVWA